MKQGFKTHIGLVVLALSFLSSCKVIRPYEQPNVTTAGLYRDQTTGDTTTLANLPYTELFSDPILQGLIREGIAQNLDLRVAYTRIQQSQAYYEQSRAAFLPSVNANAGVTESRLSDVQGFGTRTHLTQYQLGFSSSWEVDIWGRLRSSRRANLAALLQSEAAARAIQTSIVSAIASNYYRLLALDQQLAVTEQTVRNWDTTVATMRALKEAARVTEAAVVQSEAQRYAAEVTMPDLRQRIRETENALSVLLGRPPAAIERSRLDEQQTLAVLQTGVPVQLLANRPDVQGAEFAYRTAFELTNVARTAFYPALSITGSAGLSSLTLAKLISPGAIAASIGAGLTQPIFNRRLVRTNLLVAQAQQQATYFDFRNALLVAGQEVSDALSLHATALEKMTVRRNEIFALERSVEYTQELLRNGFAIYNEVITARQSLLAAELGRVNDKLQQLQATVNLYRSLGGGWR
ncbi:MAG: efflux transporter outer membrane subunit [Microcoleus sp. Co-bin12]|nr:efflux transporter outer membrane subunit [Microcoleus sp. Co-bin12]